MGGDEPKLSPFLDTCLGAVDTGAGGGIAAVCSTAGGSTAGTTADTVPAPCELSLRLRLRLLRLRPSESPDRLPAILREDMVLSAPIEDSDRPNPPEKE